MSQRADIRVHAEQVSSVWLVPTLTLASSINILSARALPVFLPVVAADLGTSVAVLGQVPASMLLLAGGCPGTPSPYAVGEPINVREGVFKSGQLPSSRGEPGGSVPG